MNEFKHIFSEYLIDLSTAVKLGVKFSKTPYTIAREFSINFNFNDPSLGRYLFESLEDKKIWKYLLDY